MTPLQIFIRGGRAAPLRLMLVVALAVGLTGCGRIRDWWTGGGGQAAEALPYRANLSKGADRHDFTVTVRAPGAAVTSVRESVRFPATRYCLETFGVSDALWTTDPATGDWAVTRNGDTMVFTGRCTAR